MKNLQNRSTTFIFFIFFKTGLFLITSWTEQQSLKLVNAMDVINLPELA